MTIKPSHTQIPDAYLDIVMRHVSPAEFKVLMAISRFTFGWQKNKDQISLQQLMEYTTLSNKGVINCLRALEKNQLIFVKREDWKKGKANTYEINLEWDGSMNSVHRESVNSVHRRKQNLGELSSLTKDSKRQTNRQSGTVDKSTPKELNPAIKEQATKIYMTDPKKYARLIAWIKAAERNYSTEVIAATLEQFVPYAEGVKDWWPYLDKILDKTEARTNAREFEREHEQVKRQEKHRDLSGRDVI